MSSFLGTFSFFEKSTKATSYIFPAASSEKYPEKKPMVIAVIFSPVIILLYNMVPRISAKDKENIAHLNAERLWTENLAKGDVK